MIDPVGGAKTRSSSPGTSLEKECLKLINMDISGAGGTLRNVDQLRADDSNKMIIPCSSLRNERAAEANVYGSPHRWAMRAARGYCIRPSSSTATVDAGTNG